jgi:hypothetical protein
MDYTLLIAGFGGGIIRGLVGFTKHQYSYKSVPFKWWYFLMMIFISGLVGLAAGWLAKGFVAGEESSTEISAFYAFIAGYAGGDFIENVYKIVTKKTSLYSLPDLTGQTTK